MQQNLTEINIYTIKTSSVTLFSNSNCSQTKTLGWLTVTPAEELLV